LVEILVEAIKYAEAKIRTEWCAKMGIDVNWSPEVSVKLPQLAICIGLINGVTARKENERLRQLKKILYEEVRSRYNIVDLKDDSTVRDYRDLYWKLGIDPTKTRPAGETLVRRVLRGDELPNISTVVDAYNMASLKTMVPMSGFDRDCIAPPFQVRFARNGEAFTGIGMRAPMSLTENMLVLADRKQVLCIYPHCDSDKTKITLETKNAAIVGYGAPGILQNRLREAVAAALSLIKQSSGGEIESIEVFQNSSV
jgi:DNA/RNA-binding domain of Phe-tRNA-synthetase-like protein